MRRTLINQGRLCVALALTAWPAAAQNTGGVPGPVVREHHEAWQYRVTYDADSSATAQRLHYERAPDARNMFRIVAQGRKTSDEDLDFDFVQGEWFHQFTAEGERWQRGIRVDARLRDRGRPGTAALFYMTQYAIDPRWSVRFDAITQLDIGDGRRSGLQLEARANLAYNNGRGDIVGLESFQRYGSTAKINEWDQQGQQFGPFWMHRFDNGVMFFAGALFGLTDASADTEYRLWLDWQRTRPRRRN